MAMQLSFSSREQMEVALMLRLLPLRTDHAMDNGEGEQTQLASSFRIILHHSVVGVQVLAIKYFLEKST